MGRIGLQTSRNAKVFDEWKNTFCNLQKASEKHREQAFSVHALTGSLVSPFSRKKDVTSGRRASTLTRLCKVHSPSTYRVTTETPRLGI